MAMPETAMDKQRSSILGKEDIRFSRQTWIVYPVTEATKP